jgi:hypothetical protein
MPLYEPAKWGQVLANLSVVPDASIQAITSALDDAAFFKTQRSNGLGIYSRSEGRALRPDELDPRTEQFYIRAFNECVAVLSNPMLDAAKYAACEMLAVSLHKRRLRVEQAAAHFQVARTGAVIAPSAERDFLRAQGRAGTQADLAALKAGGTAIAQGKTHLQLVNRKFQPGKSLEGANNYWLEKADPLHRAWGHVGIEIFNAWANDPSIELDFFTWADRNRDQLAVRFPDSAEILFEERGVRYLSRAEKFQYRVKFSDSGVFLRRSREELRDLKVSTRLDLARMKQAAQFKPFSTAGYDTLYNGTGFAIWVCGPTGKFYSHRHKKDTFHHSSFFAGDEVICGGEWAISQGELVMICDKTGHYAATQADFHKACKLLVDAKVNIENAVYETADYAVNGWDRKFYWLWDWYRHYPHNTAENTPLIDSSNPFTLHAARLARANALNSDPTLSDSQRQRLLDAFNAEHQEHRLNWASALVAAGASPAGAYRAWYDKRHAANRAGGRRRAEGIGSGGLAGLGLKGAGLGATGATWGDLVLNSGGVNTIGANIARAATRKLP